MFRDAVKVSFLSHHQQPHEHGHLHDSLHLFGVSCSLTLPKDTHLLLAFTYRPVNLKPTSEQPPQPPLTPPLLLCSCQGLCDLVCISGDGLEELSYWRAYPGPNQHLWMRAGLELACIKIRSCNHSASSPGMKCLFGGTAIWRPVGLCFLSCLVSTMCV